MNASLEIMAGIFSKRVLITSVGIGTGALLVAKILSRSGAKPNFGARGVGTLPRAGFHALDDYPDLRGHNNCMAHHLSPRLYSKLKDKQTPNGFTLDKAIQTGG